MAFSSPILLFYRPLSFVLTHPDDDDDDDQNNAQQTYHLYPYYREVIFDFEIEITGQTTLFI